MSGSEGRISLWQRMFVYMLGGFLGALAVVYYLREQQRQRQTAEASGRERASRGPAPITLPLPPRKAAEEDTDALTLSLSAHPAKFKRGAEGMLRAKTLPGARCTIEARYSTGRAPGGLAADPLVADEDGTCEWVWTVGTSGTHVDVEVTASAEGMEVVTKTKRVQIAD